MTARVLFVGLDAAEPELLRTGISDATLPSLAALESSGTSGALANCMDTLPGAVWPEINSGISCGRLPRFFHPRQIITGEAAPRPLTTADVADDPAFWLTASERGHRVAVVDLPHTPLTRVNGVHIVEYGLHDTHFGPASFPADRLSELRQRHGTYPVASCDHRGGDVASNLALLDDLLAGIERKTRLLLDLLDSEEWDLFACAFSESHCAGHWFWHYGDPAHHSFEPDADPRLRDAVKIIYRALDDSIGRLIERAAARHVIVLASHGMGPYVAGYQLLPEVLARLGLSSGQSRSGAFVRRVQHTVKNWIPRRHWERIGSAVVENAAVRRLLAPVQAAGGAMFFPLESGRTRAAYVPNNTIGAIRLNLAGREPFGMVKPGAEADALLEDLRSELLALTHPVAKVPIVSSTVTAKEAFGADHHPDVPDLIVRFRQDLGLLEACESPRTGTVHVPVGSRWGRRSGDHSSRSAVWITGDGYPAGVALDSGALVDIAPTILAALECPLPVYVEGQPLRPRV